MWLHKCFIGSRVPAFCNIAIFLIFKKIYCASPRVSCLNSVKLFQFKNNIVFSKLGYHTSNISSLKSFVMPPKTTKKTSEKEDKSHELSSSESEDDTKVESNNKKKTKKESVGKKRAANTHSDSTSKKAKVDLLKPETDLRKINFDCEKTTPDGEKWNFKISTWNVGGLRAWVKKNGLDYIKHEDPDILCLQETKCPEKKLPLEVKVKGYHTYWLSGEKDGYCGVALYTKEKPIKIHYGIDDKQHDTEGRIITAEYEQFYLVTAYVPNAGQGLKTLPKRMKWDPDFRNYLKKLDDKKPLILCGDLNVAHNEIDLANPKTNTKNAGFTQEERDGMSQLLKEGFIDTFRKLYPDQKAAYTFWSYFSNARARNIGWRLDYFVLSERFLPHLCDNVIRSGIYGSDHCPVTLFLHL